jgi:hypothetical protein
MPLTPNGLGRPNGRAFNGNGGEMSGAPSQRPLTPTGLLGGEALSFQGTGTGTCAVDQSEMLERTRGGLGVVGALEPSRIPSHMTQLTQSPTSHKGLVDAFAKTCQRWHLSSAEQVILLGYMGSEFLGQQLLEGLFLQLPQDARDRVGHVLGISIGLGALFDEQEQAELSWLMAPRDALRGQSALNFMLEGRMVNLMIVGDMVAHERGL